MSIIKSRGLWSAWVLAFAFHQPLEASQFLWNLNDVSVLFPLPQNHAEDSALLGANSPTPSGPLLSQEHFELLPDLNFNDTENYYAQLRVVGMRIDPCFPTDAKVSACRQQVRLVWQVIFPQESEFTTLDAAVHTFYDFSETDFEQFLRALHDINLKHRVNNWGLALGVHPTIQKQTLLGPFMKDLRELLLQSLGPARLSKVTFMQLRGSGNVWSFAGFDRQDLKFVQQKIPRIEPLFQSFRNNSADHGDFQNGGPIPGPSGEDTFNMLMRDSRKYSISTHREEILLASQASLRIQNPLVHNVHTVDCLSCHAAQPVEYFVERRFPELKIYERFAEDLYSLSPIRFAAYNLENISPQKSSTRSLRAFGYFEDDPAVNQRTINESAEVSAFLNRKYW